LRKFFRCPQLIRGIGVESLRAEIKFVGLQVICRRFFYGRFLFVGQFRVKLSCAMGDVLYPHAQWQRLAALWERLYPARGLDPERTRLFAQLEATMPGFVALLVNHRPQALRGRSLVEALDVGQRQPAQLAHLFEYWSREPGAMYRAAPTLVFAVLGQARGRGAIAPEEESELVAKLLSFWALRSTLDMSSACAVAGQSGLATAMRIAA